jgi:parallel beta-helix repeat protein
MRKILLFIPIFFLLIQIASADDVNITVPMQNVTTPIYANFTHPKFCSRATSYPTLLDTMEINYQDGSNRDNIARHGVNLTFNDIDSNDYTWCIDWNEIGDNVFFEGNWSSWTRVIDRDGNVFDSDYLNFTAYLLPSLPEIVDCSVLDQEGMTYYLVADIINSPASTCMNITADNVTLDCQGHIIDGISASDTYGVFYTGWVDDFIDNVTVVNCVITDWGDTWDLRGIYVEYSNHTNIKDCRMERAGINFNSNVFFGSISDSTITESGILLGISNYNNITNTVVSNFTYNVGLYLYQATYSNFINVTSLYSNLGIFIQDSSYNLIKDSKIEYNSYGIYFYQSSDNIIYNNLFNNTINSYFDGDIYSNYWNTTKTLATNIVEGSYIGGNYWGTPDLNGYSDTCIDADYDGICDDIYYLIDGICEGTVTPCEEIRNETDCWSQKYCYWESDACNEWSLMPCNYFRSESECEMQKECSWNTTLPNTNNTDYLPIKIMGVPTTTTIPTTTTTIPAPVLPPPPFRLWQGLVATFMGAGGLLFLLRTFVEGSSPREKIDLLIGGTIVFVLIIYVIGWLLGI